MEHKKLFPELEAELYPCFRLEVIKEKELFRMKFRTLIKSRSSHDNHVYAIPHAVDKIHTFVPDNRMINDFLGYCHQSVEKRIPTINPESDEDIKESNAVPISKTEWSKEMIGDLLRDIDKNTPQSKKPPVIYPDPFE